MYPLDFSIYKIILFTIEIVILIFLFQTGQLLFLFFTLMSCVGPPVQCWMEVVRTDIFDLFLILMEKHSLFHHKCGLSSVFFAHASYQVEEAPFYSYFVQCLLEFSWAFMCLYLGVCRLLFLWSPWWIIF